MRGREAENPRRNDWRFLLPTARQQHVCDVTDQRLAQLLPHSPNGVADHPYDLVVGSDPGPKQLEHAFASLRPGGICYFEWRARFRPSAGALRRRLEGAGFGDVRLYWSWPREIPSVWVPLEAPSSVRWVLRRRHPTAAAAVWRAANAARLLAPRCATAARPPFDENVGPLGVPLGDVQNRPFWALFAPGSSPLNKLVAFVVASPHRDGPALVLKIPRTEAAVAPLEREAVALRALQSTGDSPDGVPRLLFQHREATGLQAIVETPLQGRPLSELLDRHSHPALARQATDWLVELARMRPTANEHRTTVGDLASQAAADAAPAHRELLVDAGRLASSVESLPVVFEQRDFSPWNVHVGRDGELVVFDWESAEPNGFPALDLIYLLAYCGFFLDRALESGHVLESYRTTLKGNGVVECLTSYCRELAIDPAHLPALRTLTWLVHAQSALHRNPDGAEAALFLKLLRAEMRITPPDAPS